MTHQPITGPAFAAGLLAAFVGFASSFAVIIQGLSAMGASPAEAASGLMALAVAMGLGGVLLSLKSRMPISLAWSTPGAALLANSGTPDGGFAVAVGAFIVCGLAILLAGAWKPLARAVALLPASIANAMLAGVLFGLCLAPVRAVAEFPWLGLSIVGAWLAVSLWRKLWAVPAALLMTLALILFAFPMPDLGKASLLPDPVFIWPQFSLSAIIGIALPLFLVTMASQNLPGMAVLNVNGYRPDAGPLFSATGLLTLLAAPFGGHAVNLAAITAALCAGPDVDPKPERRYWAGVVSGGFYILFGLGAGAVMALISAAPPVLIQAVAGLALLGSLAASLSNALAVVEEREAAVITFIVTASGLTLFGIGGAFWGLLAGGAVLMLTRWRAKKS